MCRWLVMCGSEETRFVRGTHMLPRPPTGWVELSAEVLLQEERAVTPLCTFYRQYPGSETGGLRSV